MRRVRKVKPPSKLDELSWSELDKLRQAGAITAEEAKAINRDQLLRVVGFDPYAHLRQIGDDE